MVTTIDLLISLGIKIADIMPLLLNKKASPEEKQQAQELVEQCNQIKETHLQLQAVVQQYNQAMERMLVKGGPQELFPFCTYEEYQRVEQQYNSCIQHQINYQKLDGLEILSIDLTIQTLEEFRLDAVKKASYQRANVYTRERWINLYQNGARLEQDVINCYKLVRSNKGWKIADSEIFAKTR
jgi:hypothetical protein